MLKASSFTGPVHILRMHSNNSQGQLAVAYTQKALLEVFKAFDWKEPSTPTECFLGTIIDLPARHISKIKAHIFDKLLENFTSDIRCGLCVYIKEVQEFPPGITACSCLDFKAGDDIWQSFHSQKVHDCEVCIGAGFALTEGTLSALAIADKPHWIKDIPIVGPDTSEKIYLAGIGSGFGRKSGANITDESVIETLSKYYGNVNMFGNLMFAFTGEEIAVPLTITQWIEAENLKKAEKKKTSVVDRKRDRVAENAKYMAKTFSKLNLSADVLQDMTDKFINAQNKNQEQDEES